LVTILGIGTVSYFSLPHRLNPELEIPIVIVSTALPGASPGEVEALLTIPLEREINSVAGIDTLNSTSANSSSSIVVQFVSGTNPDEAKDEVQNAVDEVAKLPEDATTPRVFALDFEDQPVWSLAIMAKNSDLSSLMTFANNLKNSLEDQPEINRVTTTGLENRQVVVSFRTEDLIKYQINPIQMSDLMSKALASYPAGNLHTDSYTYAFTIDPIIENLPHIRELVINYRDQRIQLGQIAEVSEKPADKQPVAWMANADNPGRQIITLHVYKNSQTNIERAGEKISGQIAEWQDKYPGQFETVTIMNTAKEISDQFTELLGEFRSTILLVFASLLIFLGIRQALISSITVPLTFLSAFIFMNAAGMSINFLSLFAFLLTLGLLVDDTIVVVSAMTRYYRTGKFTPYQTGILVWNDTIVPIWSTTLTTIWSFVPLLLSTGIIGEFIKPIPIVVTAAMISSTGIAVLITLPMMIILLKPEIPRRVKILGRLLIFAAGWGLFYLLVPPRGIWTVAGFVYLALAVIYFSIYPRLFSDIGKVKIFNWMKGPSLRRFFNRGILDIETLAQAYYRLIYRILESPKARRFIVVAIVAYAVVAFTLLPLGLVRNEFFPKVVAEQIYVNLEMPPGTNLVAAQIEGQKLLEQLRTTEGVNYVIAESARNLNAEGNMESGTNLVQFTLLLPNRKQQKDTSIEISEMLRTRFGNYPSGKVSVVEISGGPPAGADLQIKLLGDNLAMLDVKADQVIKYLESQEGTVNVSKSLRPGTSKVVFKPDDAQVAAAGLSRESIGLWMRAYASDWELETINLDDRTNNQEKILFHIEKPNSTLADISRLMVPNTRGQAYPLLTLGNLETQPNPTSISRENSQRTISVSAGVRPGYSITDLNTRMEEYVDNELDLPENYSWQTGGINEENQKSVNSILQAMGLAFILILVTMVVQFNSFRQAAIVLMVIPLAVSSVFAAFGLTNTPLSFPALIGILSLFGIVVTNSMFIVDKINLNLRENMPFTQAVANAGSSRLEPIVLTKLATILGLLPITLADPLWRGLGGAIISGLLIASTIMLFFIPVVYYQWFKPRTGNNMSRV
jgi:HAE1 family hydrophobic/amphiphilic exporter-1